MDGKNRELTPEEEAAELAKPGAHPEWEINLPADLQKAIQDYLEGIRTQVTYLDCLWDELYGSTNANQWGWEISKEQADYLRAKYLFGPEDEEEDFHQTQSWSAAPLSDKTGQRLFCAQQHGPGEPLLAPVWPGEAVFSPRWENDPAQAPKSRIRPCVGKVVKSPNIASKGGVKKEQVKGCGSVNRPTPGSQRPAEPVASGFSPGVNSQFFYGSVLEPRGQAVGQRTRKSRNSRKNPWVKLWVWP